MTNYLSILMLGTCVCFSCTGKHGQIDQQKLPSYSGPITYWNTQRKGTNHFNRLPSQEWFDAASQANIKFVRLVFEKWEGEQKDFILGNADDYQGIVEEDFHKLEFFLDYADEVDVKVVITPISLPGDRWIQSNDNKKDGRLWTDWQYREQAIQYWTDLASRLKDHPAVVGYNLVNEPHPEAYHKKHSFWKRDLPDWCETVKGGPGDLNLFNQQLVEAIRKVDQDMPIIIESGLYSTPWAFEYLTPLEDDKIIYSFHMYEPYSFVTKRINKDRFTYPSKMPIEGLDSLFHLDKRGLDNFFTPVEEWAAKHNIPANRLWVGEFGCDRRIEGAELYLADLISIFNQHQWHWSFYTYREDDGWQAMDYELGKKKVHYTYWDYQEANTMHLNYDKIYPRVKDSFWEIFDKEFKGL